MGMAAILVKGPWQFKQSFVPLPQGGSTWNLSNIGPKASEKKLLEILNIFPIQMYGPIKCTGKQTWPCRKKVKLQCRDHHFSNFGGPPVPNDLCKDSALRQSCSWRRTFLNVFTKYGYGGKLSQWTVTILAIFHSPNLRRLHLKFEQSWLSGFRGEVVWKRTEALTDIGQKVITIAHREHSSGELKIQLTLAISNSVISNNRLSRSENLVPAETWTSNNM